MRVRLLVEVAAAGLLFSFAAAGGEPRGSKPEGAAAEGALAEPTDPDDEADIRADNDPNDVGQQALEPSKSATPNSEQPTPADAARPDVDPGRD
jgi:hypothetical protein